MADGYLLCCIGSLVSEFYARKEMFPARSPVPNTREREKSDTFPLPRAVNFPSAYLELERVYVLYTPFKDVTDIRFVPFIFKTYREIYRVNIP